MLLGRRIGARCREQTTILGHGKFKMLQEAEPDARVTVFASACVRIAAHVHACPCTSSWLFRGTEASQTTKHEGSARGLLLGRGFVDMAALASTDSRSVSVAGVSLFPGVQECDVRVPRRLGHVGSATRPLSP